MHNSPGPYVEQVAQFDWPAAAHQCRPARRDRPPGARDKPAGSGLPPSQADRSDQPFRGQQSVGFLNQGLSVVARQQVEDVGAEEAIASFICAGQGPCRRLDNFYLGARRPSSKALASKADHLRADVHAEVAGIRLKLRVEEPRRVAPRPAPELVDASRLVQARQLRKQMRRRVLVEALGVLDPADPIVDPSSALSIQRHDPSSVGLRTRLASPTVCVGQGELRGDHDQVDERRRESNDHPGDRVFTSPVTIAAAPIASPTETR